MEYYSGLFDAEGCVCLSPSGSVKIRICNTVEKIPEMFRERFGGSVYKSDAIRNKKPIWSWYLGSKGFISFCQQIIPHCLIKRNQLELLVAYSHFRGSERRSIRPQVVRKISEWKNPPQVTREFFCNPASIEPTPSFYKWLAGFIEGDGSLRLHEKSKGVEIFSTSVGAVNTFPEAIRFIYQRIRGSIACTNSSPHKIAWRWICSEQCVENLCHELSEHLQVKREQCHLILDFLEIKKSKRRNDRYTPNQIAWIRSLVQEIQHLNLT